MIYRLAVLYFVAEEKIDACPNCVKVALYTATLITITLLLNTALDFFFPMPDQAH